MSEELTTSRFLVAFESNTSGRTVYINPDKIMLVAQTNGVRGVEIVMDNGHVENVSNAISDVLDRIGRR